jgi:periplasmic protein TonB
MKLLLLVVLSISFLSSPAQDKNQFFALDKNMNQTVLDSSRYILWIHEKEDSNWQWDYYRTWGPLIKSNSYADHDGTILNGHSRIYNTSGELDSAGMYNHGKKNGTFYKYKSFNKNTIKAIKQYVYVNDSLVKTQDLLADDNKNGNKDSLKNSEAEYVGGMSAWQLYLSQNFHYPDLLGKKIIVGSIWVYFVVDEEGNVSDPFIQKSVEYSLDQEALKLIKNSGKWIPGTRDGVPVRTGKLIPISYDVATQ